MTVTTRKASYTYIIDHIIQNEADLKVHSVLISTSIYVNFNFYKTFPTDQKTKHVYNT